MKHKISIFLIGMAMIGGCKSNPHKAEELQTSLDSGQSVSGNQKVGVKNGEMVVIDKMQLSEKLRDLQNTVYSLEDKVYGMRKLGSLGLYGELKSCKRKQASRQLGGTGTLIWTEPLDRVTDKEEELKLGYDESKNLVAMSEEFLKDRIERFTRYKVILQKRHDEFSEKIAACKADLMDREVDTNQSTRVMVSEAPKASMERQEINAFMCGFARAGASLQNLMINAFAKGWLALGDFKLDQNLIAASLKDAQGKSMDNAILFNGWKLAFDKSPVTVGELLNQGKDAHLLAWSYDRKSEVPGAGTCLKAEDGHWNR